MQCRVQTCIDAIKKQCDSCKILVRNCDLDRNIKIVCTSVGSTNVKMLC